MWLIAKYRPAALFTLKPGLATSTGAKTLLIPTPFAIRTALLDVAIRIEGAITGPDAFVLIQSLKLALQPAPYAIVTNLFAKILKPVRSDKARDEAMQRTIAFREYVHWQGDLSLAFQGDPETLDRVAEWLPHLTYLGRRGSFVQFLPPVERHIAEEPPNRFTLLTQPTIDGAGSISDTFSLGVMQVVDDWGPALTYQKVNVYDAAPIKRPAAGEDRLRYSLAVPYQFRQAGRGFTLYERTD